MNNGVFGELTWAASEQNKLISGARLDRHQVTNYTRAGEPTRSATLPAAFMRVEHNLANAPVMLYAGLGHTERFLTIGNCFRQNSGQQALLAPLRV